MVIGGIYAGMFTATEGGGIGAFTTVFLALVMGRLSWSIVTSGLNDILVTMAGMTPPFGVSLFVAKELADVPLSLVYRSSIPFVLAFFLCLGFCIAFEPLSTWLPAMMR